MELCIVTRGDTNTYKLTTSTGTNIEAMKRDNDT